MILDLKDICDFGLAYESTKYSAKNQIYPLRWLSLDSYTVVRVNDIIIQYGYQTKEEIEASGFFIPFFQTKAEPLAEEFIRNECPYYDKEIQRILRINNEKGSDMNYHLAFHTFVFSSAKYERIFTQYMHFVWRRLYD